MHDEAGCVAVRGGLRHGQAPRPRSQRGQVPAAIRPLLVQQLMGQVFLFSFGEDATDFRSCPKAPDLVMQILLSELESQIASESVDMSVEACVGPRGVVARRGPNSDRG